MAATTTVRVDPETLTRIAELSAMRGVSAGELLAELVAREYDDGLLDAMNADFSAMTSRRRAALGAERAAWDRTLTDGLAGP